MDPPGEYEEEYLEEPESWLLAERLNARKIAYSA